MTGGGGTWTRLKTLKKKLMNHSKIVKHEKGKKEWGGQNFSELAIDR
jgi:hypothetical protein